MPPEPTMREMSHRRSLYQYVKTFNTWAMAKATKAATKGLQPATCHYSISAFASFKKLGPLASSPLSRFHVKKLFPSTLPLPPLPSLSHNPSSPLSLVLPKKLL